MTSIITDIVRGHHCERIKETFIVLLLVKYLRFAARFQRKTLVEDQFVEDKKNLKQKDFVETFLPFYYRRAKF